MDALWPETDGDRAYKSFTTTLHRLRKLIGSAKAIRHHDGKVSLDDAYCRVDVWELEALLDGAEAAWEKARSAGSSAKAAELTEKAVGMFKAPFIAGVTPDPWSAPFLKSLRNKFIRCVCRLGRRLEHAPDWDNAIACYQRGMESGASSEEICHCLMSCCQRRGRVIEALDAYERFREALHATHGIEPSDKLTALARDLRRSRLPGSRRHGNPE
jgi:pentatricopeptide repeat protein